MNDKMVMELYSEDISRIKLPPISDKVLRAVREKKEIEKKPSDKPEHHTAPSKAHRKIPIKFIFVAMLTLLVASVPIIVILTNDASVPVAPEGSSNVSTVKEESDNPSVVANALKRIKEQQLYGEVSLSGKTEKELDELLLTYNSDSKVYEDDSYIYSFDSSGNLTELVNKTPVDENGAAVSEEEIKDKTKKLISEYFSEWEDASYEISIKENKDAYPAWSLHIIKEQSDIILKNMLVTYDVSGNVIRMVCSAEGYDVGAVSMEEAAGIALAEIRSGKYDVSEFEDKDVEINVDVKYIDNKSCYQVCISRIPIEMDIMMSAIIRIDPFTGEIISVDF